ncbi:FeoB-associated Cys-rich membrane protein [Pseudactinotalea sp. Z1732]
MFTLIVVLALILSLVAFAVRTVYRDGYGSAPPPRSEYEHAPRILP